MRPVYTQPDLTTAEPTTLERQSVLPVSLQPMPRLDDFVACGNEELMSLLQRLDAGVLQAPLYLWGESAVGKTHLLQGLCRRYHLRGNTATYIPLGQSELDPAILVGLEKVDLVCIDDVHRIAGAEPWETALFHLYNQLKEAAGVLVLTGSTAPASLSLVLADLRSRLGWGLVYQIKALPDGNRRAFLLDQARARGFDLPKKAADYVLRHYARDMRSLSQLVESLDHASLAAQRKITIPFIKSVFASKSKASGAES